MSNPFLSLHPVVELIARKAQKILLATGQAIEDPMRPDKGEQMVSEQYVSQTWVT